VFLAYYFEGKMFLRWKNNERIFRLILKVVLYGQFENYPHKSIAAQSFDIKISIFFTYDKFFKINEVFS
jgi:hypothetical protein